MKEIKIKINNPKGEAKKGNLRWMQAQLEDADVRISNTASGKLCISAKFPEHEGEEKPWRIIAHYAHKDVDEIGFWREGRDIFDGVICYTNTTSPRMTPLPGIFTFPLTRAADAALEEFIDQCVDKLVEHIDNE